LDLTATNIQNSVLKVASWDSSYLPFATYFFTPQIAPDNKIYISTFNTSEFMHVINNPDSLGLSCNILQHGFTLSNSRPNFSIPNFPNYDLGSLIGSACDTLTSIQQINTTSRSIRIYPNPSSNWLNIIYNTTDDGQFELYDVFGNGVATISLFHYFKNRLLDVSDLASGTYLAVVKENGKRVWSEKVVVVH
jgi:hypothetical protein